MVAIVFDPSAYLDRDGAVNAFGQAVKAIVRRDASSSFNPATLVLMLRELAKNTFDHSSGAGQLEIFLPTASAPLTVVYRDYGAPFNWDGATPGVSSKTGNGVNCGLGLAIIEQGAQAQGMTLQVVREPTCTAIRLAGRMN
jgi:hypothetical protein